MMFHIVCTCGHKIKDYRDLGERNLMMTDSSLEHVASHTITCPKCNVKIKLTLHAYST